ncbi:MAG: DUF2608 domain-containing protein [Parachlamydiaceae bacterium]|nr:DUF2608 domain-containing protein [Parachlamydiaceae bacterium]
MYKLLIHYSPLSILRLFNRSLLICILIFSSSLSASTSSIFKIDSLEEISTSFPNDSLILFDIDETLIDSPHMLGSKAWRSYMSQLSKSSDQNWHDIFSLYLSQKYPYITVEPITSEYVHQLQMQGHVVCGLTARERHSWYDTPNVDVDLLTIRQLKSVGISFDTDILSQKYPILAKKREFFSGVFFADTDLKGDYLRKVFGNDVQCSEMAKMVVFIDDKLKQVQSVDAFLEEKQIDHICYWYCATDSKADKFDPDIANIQLYFFLSSNGALVLSDEMARALQQENSKMLAEDYLKAIFEFPMVAS